MKGDFMQKELEIEIKSLITQEQFEQFQHLFFTNQAPLVQKNTYFDTKNHALKDHRMALRIRESHTEHLLTLKSKQDVLSSFEYSVAFEHSLDQTLANSPSLAKKIPVSPDSLLPIASFTTHRYTIQLSFGLLCLDMTYYENTHRDFEIEIEIASKEQLETAISWLRLHGISHHQSMPKIARALAAQSAQ